MEVSDVTERLQLVERQLKKYDEEKRQHQEEMRQFRAIILKQTVVNKRQQQEEMRQFRAIILKQAMINKRQTAEILKLRRIIQEQKKEQRGKEKDMFYSESTDQEPRMHSCKEQISHKDLTLYKKALNYQRQQTTQDNGKQTQKAEVRKRPNVITTSLTMQQDKQPLDIQERGNKLGTKRFFKRLHQKATGNPKPVQIGKRETKRLLVQNAGLGTTDQPVAFQSALTTFQYAHIGINQPIVFDRVFTNLGGGYNAHHGVFIVPAAGLYLLQASVSCWSGHTEVESEITVNGNGIVRLIAKASETRHNQGSNMAIVQLRQGDDVAVRSIGIADDAYLGNLFTSFSGVLLQRM